MCRNDGSDPDGPWRVCSNAPIIGYTAVETGVHYILVYDNHDEGGGPVDVAVSVNNYPPVKCADLQTSNCNPNPS